MLWKVKVLEKDGANEWGLPVVSEILYSDKWRKGKFGTSRGLMPGDPLSSFLFTLVVDVLNRIMKKARDYNLIEELVVGREEVEITHLQFADDTIFFLKDDDQTRNNLNNILETFCLISENQ